MATPARDPACYSAVEGAQAGSPALGQLHHSKGHDPPWCDQRHHWCAAHPPRYAGRPSRAQPLRDEGPACGGPPLWGNAAEL